MMNAPKAKKIDKSLEIHGHQRNDPFFWLNERENPEVLQYLEEENAYCDFVMKDTEELQEQLFQEMKARYKEDAGEITLPLAYYRPLRHYRDWETDRKSTRLNSSHRSLSRMPSSA